MTEDEMVGWHHRLNEHEFEQTPGDSEGTGKPGVPQFMGSQRARHDLVTEEKQATGWTASITISTPTSGFLPTELIPIPANPFHLSLFFPKSQPFSHVCS